MERKEEETVISHAVMGVIHVNSVHSLVAQNNLFMGDFYFILISLASQTIPHLCPVDLIADLTFEDLKRSIVLYGFFFF